MHHFSLGGRHLESVSQPELIFELNLALSKERLICEFRSDSDNCYRVIVFRSLKSLVFVKVKVFEKR